MVQAHVLYARGGRLLLALLTIGILLLAGTAQAATYYVATSGNDGSAGTATAPWRTLQYAAGRVQAGDTVIVRAGSYAGFVLGWDFPQNGTAGAPITFSADPGVIITSRNNKTADGINLEGASYITITGFTVNNADGSITRAGIRTVENNHVIIRNNVCDKNGTWGIFTSHSDDLLIEGNVATHAVSQHGIYVSNACVRPVVRGNTIYGNYACGLHMNGDISMGGNGIISEALIENNVIYENGVGGGSAINCDGVINSVFRNNLCYTAHGAGISFYQIDAAAPSTDNLVVNNTIDVASNGKWAIQLHNGSSGNVLFNNIFLNHNTSHGSIHIDDGSSLAGTVSDDNIFIAGSHAVTTDDDSSYLSLVGWQALGYDTHSRTADWSALFLDWTTGNYHLAAGSPAIDAGAATLGGYSAPPVDCTGAARPAGNGFDIGCYEVGGGTVTNLPPTVATPASATPSTVTGKTVALSVLGADDAGEANLTYTWTASAPVTFSANGSNAAKNVTATFTQAGAYTFTATITDVQGLSATSSVTVTVSAVCTTVSVSPATATVAPLGTQQFAAGAKDQFGNALATPAFTWSASGGGAISPSGLFTAGSSAGGPFTVTASAGGVSGTASVTVAAPRTNLARTGTGYRWYGLTFSTSNAHRTAAAGVNDGKLTDVSLHSGDDVANAYEAAGVIWKTAQTVTSVNYINGGYTTGADGVFCADFKLQMTTDGLTWIDVTGWTLAPAYAYNSSAAAGVTYAFTGPAIKARGIRCVGQVHTSPQAPNSWYARVREVQAF